MRVLDFRIDSSRVGSTGVVAVAGDLDLHTAERLSDALRETSEEAASCVVVDLLAVTVVDSAGLGVLASSARSLKARGGKFVLATDDAQLLRTLRITGLDRMFDVQPTLTEAIHRALD